MSVELPASGRVSKSDPAPPRIARARLPLSRLLIGVLALGLLVRLWLVLIAFPAQGFAPDMRLFVRWGEGLLQSGPSAFYESVPTANYPPVAIWLLGGLALAAHGIAPLVHASATDVLAVLIKVPSAVADVASATLVFRLARSRAGRHAALFAATAFLLLPPVWYDSALWGQLDSIVLLGSLGAMELFIEGYAVAGSVAAVLTMLVKPQGVLVVLVILVASAASELRSADAPSRRVRAIATVLVGAGATFLIVIMPFDYDALAPAGWGTVPVAGDVAGFVQQSVRTANLFPVLTANAYNLWALVGNPALASSMASGRGWVPDSLRLWGIPAVTVGSLLLGVAVVATLTRLAFRHERGAVLGAFTVLSFAFYALPTRSHERYLVPVFGALAVLAAASFWRWLAVMLVAIVNTVNLHAVLAIQQGGSVHAYGVSSIALRLGGDVRLEPVIVLSSLLQTAAAIIVAVIWLSRRSKTGNESGAVARGPVRAAK